MIVFRIRHYWEIRKVVNEHKSAAHFMQIRSEFLRKVANRQTDKQTTTKTYPPLRRYKNKFNEL